MKGSANVSLQQEHLIMILKDILENQHKECCGSVSEWEQAKRLIKSLLMDENLDQRTKSILTDIYSYCQQGAYSADINQHVQDHQNQLSQWVSEMNQLL